MNTTRASCRLVFLALAFGCSNGGGAPKPDGSADRPESDPADTSSPSEDMREVAPDVGQDLPSDRNAGPETGHDLAADDGPTDAVAAEVSGETGGEVAGETGVAEVRTAEAGPGDARACFWPTSNGRYDSKHFTFRLTTPDGHEQTPRSGPLDAGGWPVRDFEGYVTNLNANQFTVDACTSATCQPSIYSFTLCNSAGSGSCYYATGGTPMQIGATVGRRVRVVWRMDNDVPSFCPGLYLLVIYDAEPGSTKGNLLFVGSGGRSASTSVANLAGFWDLPLGFTTVALSCGEHADGSILRADDYAFVFAPKGSSMTLQLGTGEMGMLMIAAPAGGMQSLRVHVLDAVQPAATDDYWNYDFWAVVNAPVDGGSP